MPVFVPHGLHKKLLSVPLNSLLPRPGITNANNAIVTARRIIALIARDQWIPIKPPITPTVTPLKARKPLLDMLNNPIKRPRSWAGACPS